ncbi:MAG TPA: gfo/Idh/MocA family oxidoreductase, partial [Planctomycetaceae bacterium]|nr:gfo/Idh/MocA family oxidoreductase [Planctomycetaceae bacterium]
MTQPTFARRPASDSAVSSSRRDFLKVGAVAATIPALAAQFASSAHASGSDTLKVGLIGCGGRGSGAAVQALSADPNVELVAMGDAFGDALNFSLTQLTKNESLLAKVKVDDDHKFVGLDAYKKVIDVSDVVLLASPPG